MSGRMRVSELIQALLPFDGNSEVWVMAYGMPDLTMDPKRHEYVIIAPVGQGPHRDITDGRVYLAASAWGEE